MKLLILPSHRLLYYHGKHLFTLLPEAYQAQQCTTITPLISHHHEAIKESNLHKQPINNTFLATLHYKTVNIYKFGDIRNLAQKIAGFDQNKNSQIQKVTPYISETFPKKLEVIDLYNTIKTQQNNNLQASECIISDKFGDMYRIPIPPYSTTSTQVHSTSTYQNSNLGIPKYIKHISLAQTSNKQSFQYIVLADQQNRIKVYNSHNLHELISVWFMVNMYSIQCQVLKGHDSKDIIVMLFKYFNKITLEEDIRLYYFEATKENIQAEQFPGIQVKSTLKQKITKQCKFYTTISLKPTKQFPHSSILLLYLFENKIIYELFTVSTSTNHGQVLQFHSINQIPIQEGKWDYLYGIDTQDGNGVYQVVVAFGCDVQMPVQISIPNQNQKQGKNTFSLLNKKGIELNKYEKIIKLDLKL